MVNVLFFRVFLVLIWGMLRNKLLVDLRLYIDDLIIIRLLMYLGVRLWMVLNVNKMILKFIWYFMGN